MCGLWDVKKVFDELKSKMGERKSWASGKKAKKAHGVFECLAHNLTLLFECELKEDGLEDEREKQKAEGRKRTRKNREGVLLKEGKNFVNTVAQRATQRTVRFFRWLRTWLYSEAPWEKAVDRLRVIWGVF